MLDNNSNFRRSSLDKLAQIGTKVNNEGNKKPLEILHGTGADLSNTQVMENRGKRKMINNKVILSIIKIAKKKGNKPLITSLCNTYRCQEKVTTADGRLYCKYCKNRFCSTCSGIRKAEKIRVLLPVVETWTNPQFVTLTARSVTAKSLPRRMEDMNLGLRKILDKQKKRAQRGKGIKLIGFKSLECNFNPKKRTYNPHLHLIVENEEMANLIIKEWLTLCTKKFASPKAQLGVPVKNIENSLVEVIKYSTKQFTDPDPNDKKGKASQYVYAAAMYNIIAAMNGLRIFERFGFNLPKSSRKETQIKEVDNIEDWVYNAKVHDWQNSKGQNLTGFSATEELIHLLTNNINLDLD